MDKQAQMRADAVALHAECGSFVVAQLIIENNDWPSGPLGAAELVTETRAGAVA